MKRPQRLLTRYTGTRQKKKPLLFVDIETRAIGRGEATERDFLQGAFIDQYSEDVTFFNSLEEWMNIIFQRKYACHIWYAHNGGEFDYKFLIPYLNQKVAESADMDYERIDDEENVGPVSYMPMQAGNGGRVIGFKIKKGKQTIELRDSFALVPTSLKKFGESIGNDIPQKQDFDHETTDYDPQNIEHQDYLRHDVLTLRASLVKFLSILEEHYHVAPAWTVPSTAMRGWRATIPEDHGFWRQRQEVDALVRKAYFGGLVFARTVARQYDAAAIDVNSMYPYVMRKYGVPTGTGVHVRERHTGFYGFYTCRVHADENKVKFRAIPSRDETGALLWPVGDFDTTLSSVDIDLGLELGYEIEIIEGFEWPRCERIFDQFVNTCERLRRDHKGTAIELAAKLLQNGLYGKFGSRFLMQKTVVSNKQPGPQYHPLIDEKTGESNNTIWQGPEILDAAYIQPHWAAWITSNARATLVRMALQIGVQNVYYGDTDSITADRAAIEHAHIPTGSEYGQVKVEHVYEWFQAIGPKVYIGRIAVAEKDMPVGSYIYKAKGIPKRIIKPDDMLHLIEHAKERKPLKDQVRRPKDYIGFDPVNLRWYFHSTNSTMQVLTHDAPFYEQRTRTLSDLTNSKSVRGISPDGLVLPVVLAHTGTTREPPANDFPSS